MYSYTIRGSIDDYAYIFFLDICFYLYTIFNVQSVFTTLVTE